MNTIKFSHEYEKMPLGILKVSSTMLLEVFKVDSTELCEHFRIYDTLIKDKNPFYFESLPEGKLLVLLLKTDRTLWTTIRRWTPEKENYYRKLRGDDIKIEITKDTKQRNDCSFPRV